jgi:hypothetical protein
MMGGKTRAERASGTQDGRPLATLKAEQARLAEKISALERATHDSHEQTGAELEESERTTA